MHTLVKRIIRYRREYICLLTLSSNVNPCRLERPCDIISKLSISLLPHTSELCKVVRSFRDAQPPVTQPRNHANRSRGWLLSGCWLAGAQCSPVRLLATPSFVLPRKFSCIVAREVARVLEYFRKICQRCVCGRVPTPDA